jgi:hypothetical protein
VTRRKPHCFVTRDEFMAAVGVVNADVRLSRTTTVRYATRYPLVAERIAGMARRIEATVLATVTDDGLHVVTVKGFGGKTWIA